MGGAAGLLAVIHAIAAGDGPRALALVDEHPGLVREGLAREDEALLPEHRIQLYAGDTVLHVAAAIHDPELVQELLARSADTSARNRRGAEPLHAAVRGGPGSAGWESARQVAVIRALVAAGAQVDAEASGAVTPLHRAVRNRCSAAVGVLLELGADPKRQNGGGSTAADLAVVTTGRPGSGSPEAKAEQQVIAGLLGT